ncbi:MAG: hypothetical protein LWX08_06420 [Deltaproteobacteria bacterium]|jgi:hypothetical protein|nr:hypothetical protein [Deltaproteobacteria bacterium]
MKISFKDIEEGIYKAKVSQVKEDIGHYGAFLRIVFTVLDGELEHYRFTGLVKPSSLKQSKFYKWVTNILGKEPACEFYTKDLIGKECLICLSKQKKFYSVIDVQFIQASSPGFMIDHKSIRT